MKLQLTPQALRLRLSDEEIRELAQAGQLSHTLYLGGQGLTYTLRQLSPDSPTALSARYEGGTLAVEVPAALARQLMEGNSISVKGEMEGTDGRFFRILVEKDLGPSH